MYFANGRQRQHGDGQQPPPRWRTHEHASSSHLQLLITCDGGGEGGARRSEGIGATTVRNTRESATALVKSSDL